jgi:hypothetical protein
MALALDHGCHSDSWLLGHVLELVAPLSSGCPPWSSMFIVVIIYLNSVVLSPRVSIPFVSYFTVWYIDRIKFRRIPFIEYSCF